MTEFPPEFREYGVGGSVSPQLLAGKGQAVAFDLRVPEVRIEPFAQAVRRLGAREVPRDQLQVCGSPTDPVPNVVYAVRVSAGGHDGSMLLDSGAGVSKVVTNSGLLRGIRLGSGGQTTGLAGKAEPFRLARDLELSFDGFRARVDARAVDQARESCGPDGILALDALRGCALVLGELDVAITCSE